MPFDDLALEVRCKRFLLHLQPELFKDHVRPIWIQFQNYFKMLLRKYGFYVVYVVYQLNGFQAFTLFMHCIEGLWRIMFLYAVVRLKLS